MWSSYQITAEDYLRSEYPNMISSEVAIKVLNEKGILYLKDFLGERRQPDRYVFISETGEEGEEIEL